MRAEHTLRLGGRAEIADLGSFLERAVRMDAAVLVRLRADPAGRTVSACLRLPFGVLVGRTVRAVLTGDADQTVRAADLAADLANNLAADLANDLTNEPANDLTAGGPQGLILPERHGYSRRPTQNACDRPRPAIRHRYHSSTPPSAVDRTRS